MVLMDLVCDNCFPGRALTKPLVVMSAVNGMVYVFPVNWRSLG